MNKFAKGVVKIKKPKAKEVIYRDGIFHVRSNGLIRIKNQHNIGKESMILYSLPTNDKHKKWTKHILLENPNRNEEIVCKFWGKYKPKMRVFGTVIDGEFVINRIAI